jgi:hypothetical protein
MYIVSLHGLNRPVLLMDTMFPVRYKLKFYV